MNLLFPIALAAKCFGRGGRFIFVALAVLTCAFSGTNLQAQTNTNLITTCTVNLTGYIQQPTNGSSPPAVTIRKFATKDIIAALASDLAQPTNNVSTAKLLLQFVGAGNPDVPDSLNAVLRISGTDTNINDIFELNFSPQFSFLANATVTTERPKPNGTKTRTDYTIMTISLSTTNLSFQTQGQVKINQSSVMLGSKIIDTEVFPTSYACSLTGSGKVGTNLAVFSGTFTVSGRKIEVE
jgi:hypothetical protein